MGPSKSPEDFKNKKKISLLQACRGQKTQTWKYLFAAATALRICFSQIWRTSSAVGLHTSLKQTFCLSCVTTPHETQTCGSSLNHSRSPDNSCLGQIGHVTERLSHRVSMVILWEVCAWMCMFAHLYTVCDQSVNSCGLGESTRWGKKKNLSERERELMKGAPDQVPSL